MLLSYERGRVLYVDDLFMSGNELMKRALKHILLILLAAAVVYPAYARNKKRTEVRPNNYTVSIGGYLVGQGKASVTATRLSISGYVTDDRGRKGTFLATNLVVDGLHFTGTGLAMGKPMTLEGRLDPMSTQESTLKTERLVCTFTLQGNLRGRVVGFVPVDIKTP